MVSLRARLARPVTLFQSDFKTDIRPGETCLPSHLTTNIKRHGERR